tara:strand:- start:830 stop:1153 length:324 start_codon:yes stop_codon:yes gene_type:complete
MDSKSKKQHQIQIELDEQTGQGEYANLTIVSHSQAEFILDFIRVAPGLKKAKVKSRIIMAPSHVKTLLNILKDNVNKYEAKFGEIKIQTQDGLKPTAFNLPDDILPN